MSRESLERHQVWIYLVAVLLGLCTGNLWPQAGGGLETLVWPALALLLYATFAQTSLRAVPQALKDLRLLGAALIGNFVLIPFLVWGLVQLVPDDEPLRVGLLLVLLVPCTDWFITFTQLGKGDGLRAAVLAPILLVVQFLLLPGYLWLMAGEEVASVLTLNEIWPALLVVLLPLGVALFGDFCLARHAGYQRFRTALSWGPVPLLGIVIFLVAASHAAQVHAALDLLPVVAGIAAGYLVLSMLIARTTASVAKLSAVQGRTLAFTFGTRNSFIVLPFALALPAGWEITAIVVVMQSLVELLGMIICLWFIPRVLFPGPGAGT